MSPVRRRITLVLPVLLVSLFLEAWLLLIVADAAGQSDAPRGYDLRFGGRWVPAILLPNALLVAGAAIAIVRPHVGRIRTSRFLAAIPIVALLIVLAAIATGGRLTKGVPRGFFDFLIHLGLG
jgi:hypothetical protein